MSVIAASGETISKHLQNTSKSKQMYSFPKSTRFINNTQNKSSTFFYNLPNVSSKRSTSLGYGNKSDFTKGTKWNAPFYKIPRLFEDKKFNAPKYTFGLSREYFRKVVVNDSISVQDNKVPGVGKYCLGKPFGSEAPKYTMTKRHSTLNLGSTVTYPGPGKYNNNVIINTMGRFPLSKFSNTARSGWSLSKEPRFKDKLQPTPGPSSYNIEPLIQGKAQLYNSQFNSPTSRTISHKLSSVFDLDLKTPGPGAYTSMSDFGIYKAKNAEEFDNKIRSKTMNDPDSKKMFKSQSMVNTTKSAL